MSLRILSQARNLKGKVALVRLDTNVPLEGNKIIDDSRLRQSLPTLRYLERRGARFILVGHLGRPAGKPVASLSLNPIGYALGKLLRQPVKVLPLAKGLGALRRAAITGPVLVENIRFERGEEANDPVFARRLARLGDLFVNEAFSVSHHTCSSLVGVAKYLPAYAGLALEHEVLTLARLKERGVKPFLAIVGGAKVADKLGAVKGLWSRVSWVAVGGAVGSTLLAARRTSVGKSLVDRAELPLARQILRRVGRKLLLPQDVVVDTVTTRKHEATLVPVRRVAKTQRILDVGTATVRSWASYVRKAKTILWVGTLGLAEDPVYAHGTKALARLVSSRARGPALVIVGGGDTVAFFHRHSLYADHFSLAGGAMLQFLAGSKLPGLVALGYHS